MLPVLTIEKAVTPYLGPGRRFADIEAARAALEKAYQDAGYLSVFVDIPEQRLDTADGAGAVVRLHVTEGKVERLAVTGAHYFSPAAIRDKVSALAEGTVPNFNTVQQQLAGVNRSEERRVQPVLRPGKTPGTVEAELKVADELPLSAEVELNNRQSPDTRPLRLSATVHYDNLFQRDQSLAFTVITAPQASAQSTVTMLNYTIPTDSGTWALYGLRSDSNVAALGSVTVLGKGTVLGARYVLPIDGPAGTYHSLSFGADLKHFDQSTTGKLRYAPLSLGYSGGAVGASSQTQVSATATLGVREWLRTEVDCYGQTVDQFECSRSGASGGFFALRFDAKHTARLWGRWSGSVRLAGQLADAPLVSNEQYAIGGVDTVRGYLEAEATGDHAALGSIELLSPNWAARDADGQPSFVEAHKWLSGVTELSGHVFFDAARAYVIDPAPEQRAVIPLVGTGLGLKLRAGKRLSGGLDLAWPLRADAPYTRAHHPRLHANVAVQF